MPNILIIDDDEPSRSMLRQLLEKNKYHVIEADNGNTGIELVHENRPDLIITDIVMPEKEGLETISDIMRDYPMIKIIAVSGGGQLGPDNYLTIAELLGAEYVFPKPIERNELLSAIKKLIGNSSMLNNGS